MARTAVVRSASLAPDEARLADELAQALTKSSFTELTRLLLRQFGEPLKRQIQALRDSGIEPGERLMIVDAVPPDTDAQIGDFYASSRWRVSERDADPRP